MRVRHHGYHLLFSRSTAALSTGVPARPYGTSAPARGLVPRPTLWFIGTPPGGQSMRACFQRVSPKRFKASKGGPVISGGRPWVSLPAQHVPFCDVGGKRLASICEKIPHLLQMLLQHRRGFFFANDVLTFDFWDHASRPGVMVGPDALSANNSSTAPRAAYSVELL